MRESPLEVEGQRDRRWRFGSDRSLKVPGKSNTRLRRQMTNHLCSGQVSCLISVSAFQTFRNGFQRRRRLPIGKA